MVGRVFILLLFMMNSLAGAVVEKQKPFFKSQVGCFSPVGDFLKFNCTEQRMAFDVLKILNRSKRKGAKNKLQNLIDQRAKHFLKQGQYDYFSVVTLMIFKVDNREEYLQKFKAIPGKRAPFTFVALDRIKGRSSRFCRKKRGQKRLPFYMREICSIKLIKS